MHKKKEERKHFVYDYVRRNKHVQYSCISYAYHVSRMFLSNTSRYTIIHKSNANQLQQRVTIDL